MKQTFLETTMILGMIALICVADMKTIEPHSCPFGGCPYTGTFSYVHAHTGAAFEPTGDIGSDCDALDWVHWNHPEWNYDQCETYLFSN
jgi:hypothetical protein